MSPEDFPASVRQLLREHLTSFEHLEILLLLHGQPLADWTPQSVCERIRMPPELAERVLVSLQSSELVRRATRNPGVFRFGPRLPASLDAVEALAALYRDQRAAVMSAMSVNAIERIRSGTMRAFADSFMLKKRNDDG